MVRHKQRAGAAEVAQVPEWRDWAECGIRGGSAVSLRECRAPALGDERDSVADGRLGVPHRPATTCQNPPPHSQSQIIPRATDPLTLFLPTAHSNSPAMHSYPAPEPGASLILAFTPATPSASSSRQQSVLLLGATRLSALRAFSALEAGYRVVVGAAKDEESAWDAEVRHRVESGEVDRIDWDLAADADEAAWREWITAAESSGALDGVRLIVLSDTIASSTQSRTPQRRRTLASAQAFRHEAERRRFLVNVADCPALSDFSFATSHRFDLESPTPSRRKSPLQLALTTNTSACRLATRLRRELVASLPKSAGSAVEAVGRLREELRTKAAAGQAIADGEDDSEETQGIGLNRPVEQLSRAKSWALDSPG